MSVYIEKQAAIDALGKPTEVYSWEDALMREQWERDKAAIEAVPPADVRPVVRGRWKPKMHPMISGELTHVKDEWYGEVYICDQCGFEMIGTENFCPNCGADMREDKP